MPLVAILAGPFAVWGDWFAFPFTPLSPFLAFFIWTVIAYIVAAGLIEILFVFRFQKPVHLPFRFKLFEELVVGMQILHVVGIRLASKLVATVSTMTTTFIPTMNGPVTHSNTAGMMRLIRRGEGTFCPIFWDPFL